MVFIFNIIYRRCNNYGNYSQIYMSFIILFKIKLQKITIKAELDNKACKEYNDRPRLFYIL